MSKESAPNQTDAPGPLEGTLHSHRERWLQLALVAVCAALEEVECTDDALTEALFVGMPGVKIDEVTAAAVAEALRRSGTLKEAAAILDRSRGFIYDSLRRRQREWASADWVAYGAELRRRRLLAGWSVAELSRRINLSTSIIYQVEQARTRLRPSQLTLAKLAAALGMPWPSSTQKVDPNPSDGETGERPK
jgi:ribosome-binding protein aMBF1 (putative translation factor)